MNWTGGRLSRHSRNANGGGITGRQKQHFAKVRSAQQGLAHMSPVKWSVFNQITTGSRHAEVAATHSSTANAPHQEMHRTKRKLTEPIEFLNSRSVAERDRSAELPTERVRDGQDTMEKRRKILSRGDWVGVSFQKPLDLKYAPPEKIEQIGRRRKVSGSHRARYEDRQREILPPPHTRAIQKESQIPKPRNPDVRISIGGKELRIGVSSSSGFAKAPVQAVQNPAQKSSSDVMLLDVEEGGNQRPSANSLLAHAYPRPFQYTPSVTGAVNYQDTPQVSKESTFTYLEHAKDNQPRLRLNDRYTNNSAGTPNLSSKRTLSTSEIRELYHNFRDQTTAQTPVAASESQDSMEQERLDPPEDHQKLNFAEVRTIIDSRSASASNDRFSPLSFVENYEDAAAPGYGQTETRIVSNLSNVATEILVCESPTLIRHPAPQSSRTSQLLQSDVSDGRLSMAVQTGRTAAASWQTEDPEEAVWKSWILPEDSGRDQSESWEGSRSEHMSLTPGISTYEARPEQCLPSSPVFANEIGQTASEHHHVAESDIEDTHDPTERDESALQLHSELDSYLHPQQSQSSFESRIREQIEERVVEPVPALTLAEKPKAKVDENSLWQKFVFTSDSDEEEAPTETQARPFTSFRMPPNYSEDSSLLAHPSTETEEFPERSREASQIAATTSTSEQELDDRVSIGATQGTRAGASPSIAETFPTQFNDVHTTRATRGSYGSSDKSGSQLSSTTSHRDSIDNLQRQKNHETKRKIVFTKPKPFVGTKSKGNDAVERIGRIGRKSSSKRTQRLGGSIAGGDKGSDLYDLSSSDEIESIEDD